MDCKSVQGLHGGSGIEAGIGLNILSSCRVEKMDDEEKKSGSKRRLKHIEIGFDSDDDEPIGSIFKLRRQTNPKKVKLGLDSGGKTGEKLKSVEARAEKLVGEDEELGGMDDTLASFRKKLRGPKKDTGSGTAVVRGSNLNVVELKDVEEGRGNRDYGSDVTMDKGLEKKLKRKSKRSKIVSTKKKTGDSVCQRSEGSSLQDQKEMGLWLEKGSNHSSDENLEDSLSAFVRKAQSGLIRRSRTSCSKKKRGPQGMEDGLSHRCEGVSEDSHAVVVKIPRSSSGSRLMHENLTSKDSLHPVSDRGLVDLGPEKTKTVENLRPGDGSGEVFNHIKKILQSVDPIKGVSSVPGATDDISRSSDDRVDQSSESIMEDTNHITALQQPHSHLVAYSNRSIEHQYSESNRLTERVQEENTVVPCDSNQFCDGDSEEFIHKQMKENSSASIHKTKLDTQNLKDVLRHCSMGKTTDLVHGAVQKHVAVAKQGGEIHGSDEGQSSVGFNDALTQQHEGVATIYHSSADQKACSSLSEKGTVAHCFDDNLLKRPHETVSKGTHKQIPGNSLEVSLKSPSWNSLPGYVKIEEPSKSETGLDFDKSSQNAELHSAYSVLNSMKMGGTSSDSDGPNQIPFTSIEEPDCASVDLEKEEDALIPDAGLSSIAPTSAGVHESGFASQMDCREKSVETDHLDESFPLIQKCDSDFHQNQPSHDASRGDHVPIHDYLSASEEANGASSPSITPDKNDAYPEDAGSMPDPEIQDNKSSSAQRTLRKPKKHRQRDMAYEGDADWEILIHEQSFPQSHLVEDTDQPLRTRGKFDSSLNMVSGTDNGGAAAVSVGLKARAVGPVEKIKFKEVLKRKGGLQEYLECRNLILGLWGKDMSRILPLADCGVADTPSKDEPPRASLIREIYVFLDHRGYINVGIASEKEKADPDSKHNYKLLKEKTFGEKSGIAIADSEDGVSFILGQGRSSETSTEAKSGLVFDDENKASDGAVVDLRTLEPSTLVEPKECLADDYQEHGRMDANEFNRKVNLDVSESSCRIDDSGTIPTIAPELMNESCGVESASMDSAKRDHNVQFDSDVRKKIIVVGAGPAGLTAARHLQRHGFSVIVLEARSRIGGRVYTDHSSLSVPVDLGASIITGVEADVDTERRPDPSSLVCAQLGLELTVLNSDCPLYDIVTGQKVPADLDEALEAEYNSLLDDMVLIVAQKGEHAMKMSLEEGLEYALKRRRMPRLGSDYTENELQNLDKPSLDSEKIIVDRKMLERNSSKEEVLSPIERRVMDWHFAHLEYGCAALLKEVSLPYWNQDDVYGGFGGAHCMIKGGYSSVIESLGEGLHILLNQVVTDVSYSSKDAEGTGSQCKKVKVSTSNGSEFSGDAVLITVPLGCLKAEAIKFLPPLPQWKHSSIQRLGFGVLNKVVLEFPEVFWDDSVDYFGATSEQRNWRGQCFMFWNVKKTVGAPVLIALVVGKAAIDHQDLSSSDHVNHALSVLRKLFGETSVPDPVASVVTNWGKDPFSYGAYSYVAVGASGEDYDILGRPVENCLFFAGEATCKEHPDTVGGAMMSGLREAVRIIDILTTGNDYTAEVEAMEAAQRHSEGERNEVRDILKRLEAVELSNVLYKSSLDGDLILTREALLQDMFSNAKTTAGRLHLAKELLTFPVEALKSFAGTKEGLCTLNSWILDSMGKDGTQLLRHCVRLLVLVSTDLIAVRLSGIGKTVKEKVCVHTSRDIRAIASQLVNVWIEVFRKEKASNGGLKLLKQTTASNSAKGKSFKDLASGKPPIRMHHGALDFKGSSQVSASARSHSPSSASIKKDNGKPVKLESMTNSKPDGNQSRSPGSVGRMDVEGEEGNNLMSEEEKVAFAAAEAARAAALAAAEAYASEAKSNTSLQLPKIPSFHKFARREQYAQMDESDLRRKWSGGVSGRQDCISEIDSRNCRVRNWSVDFPAACVNLESSRMSADNHSQRSHSNDIACPLNFREHSGESAAVDSSLFTKAWVDSAGSVGIKDYHAIERWQSQAAAADSDFYQSTRHIRDEEDSNTISQPPTWKHDRQANESSVSHVTVNKELVKNQPRGAENIKQAVVDYVGSLLMPLYKARKIDKEGYKSIMKKSATKVMEQATDVEKTMAVSEFLDFKRRNKIRSFVDKLIERHMAMNPVGNP